MGTPGPTSILDGYNHILWYWYIHENHTVTQTRSLFRQNFNNLEIYHQQPDFPNTRTLQRCFSRWGFRKQSVPYNSHCLNRELWVYFYHWGLNDVEILSFLHRRGYPLTSRGYNFPAYAA
jgi:hypothetical protein